VLIDFIDEAAWNLNHEREEATRLHAFANGSAILDAADETSPTHGLNKPIISDKPTYRY
jgi:hypothetical protein